MQAEQQPDSYQAHQQKNSKTACCKAGLPVQNNCFIVCSKNLLIKGVVSNSAAILVASNSGSWMLLSHCMKPAPTLRGTRPISCERILVRRLVVASQAILSFHVIYHRLFPSLQTLLILSFSLIMTLNCSLSFLSSAEAFF